ncbi:MAG: SCO family protein [Ilumatobacter sp.]|uniref:SCO family protein n=1 Tax=Ilumatobacter sp. TaxID=1967498 RepID=UPI002626B4C7|nr:SCO family protein [Ilumatobacter sp.]MDJ0769056.1 SCO family protein [Ilumatobacter sp.]
MRRLVATALAATTLLTACGSNTRELAGFRREPAPAVGGLAMPDLANDGDEFALRARDGGVLAVYFGFTNCPDFCPTTLSDLKLARNRLDDDEAGRVEVAMISVDPDRDLPVLVDYVTSFFDDGHALGTDDPSLLAEVAAPFGAQYDVFETDEGEIEVAHTTALYLVDDAGELALTWQFGTTIDDIAADLEQMLEAT